MPCAIWYHLYNLKNVKYTNGGVLNFAKSNTPSMGVFHDFEIVQVVPNRANCLIHENLNEHLFEYCACKNFE